MSKKYTRPIIEDITRGRYDHLINLRPQSVSGMLIISIILVFVFLITIGVITLSKYSSAQVAEFYPESCLGNWINPSFAEHIPENPDSSDYQDYENAQVAMYDGGEKQIYCGSFSGDIPESANFKSATLKIAWSWSKKKEVLTTFSTTSSSEDETESELELIAEISTSTATSTLEESIEDDIAEDNTTSTPEDTAEVLENTEQEPEEILEEVGEEVQPEEEPVVEEEVQEEAQEQETISEEIQEEEESGEDVSFLRSLWINLSNITQVLAQTSTEEIIEDEPIVEEEVQEEPEEILEEVGEEVQPEEEPVVEEEVVTSTEDLYLLKENQTTSTVPEDIIILDDSSATSTPTSTESIITATSTIEIIDDGFLVESENTKYENMIFRISYSLDGYNWYELSLVGLEDWESEFLLPIDSLEDLENIQIAIETLPETDDDVIVLLDGMTIEVGYEEDEGVEVEDLLDENATSSEPLLLEEPEPEKIIFDERSTHTCIVDPFLVEVFSGQSANTTVKIFPSRLESKVNLSFGKLPKGISGDILMTNDSSEAVVTINSEDDLKAGSYNLMIVYEEEQYDGKFLPNYCQFNFIIK